VEHSHANGHAHDEQSSRAAPAKSLKGRCSSSERSRSVGLIAVGAQVFFVIGVVPVPVSLSLDGRSTPAKKAGFSRGAAPLSNKLRDNLVYCPTG
jgi:hypothetical protein